MTIFSMKRLQIDCLTEYDHQSPLKVLRRSAEVTALRTVTKTDLKKTRRISYSALVGRFGSLGHSFDLAGLKRGASAMSLLLLITFMTTGCSIVAGQVVWFGQTTLPDPVGCKHFKQFLEPYMDDPMAQHGELWIAMASENHASYNANYDQISKLADLCPSLITLGGNADKRNADDNTLLNDYLEGWASLIPQFTLRQVLDMIAHGYSSCRGPHCDEVKYINGNSDNGFGNTSEMQPGTTMDYVNNGESQQLTFECSEYNISYQTYEQWKSSARSCSEIADWSNVGILSFDEAQSWSDLGISPQKAKAFKAKDVSPKQIAEFQKDGLALDVDQMALAVSLVNAGYSETKAIFYAAHNVGPSGVAGYEHYQSIVRQRCHGQVTNEGVLLTQSPWAIRGKCVWFRALAVSQWLTSDSALAGTLLGSVVFVDFKSPPRSTYLGGVLALDIGVYQYKGATGSLQTVPKIEVLSDGNPAYSH